MPPLDRIRSRLPHGARADALLALVVFVVVGLVAEGQRLGQAREELGSLIASWALITAVCAALLIRRRHPVAVGWFTVLGTGAYYLVSDIDGPLVIVPIVVLYALAAQGRIKAAAGMAAAMVAGLFAATLTDSSDLNGTAVFMLAGWLVAVVALGNGRRSRMAYAEEEARLRATEERLRIARELHDVIGHNISMINVQAGAARHRLKKEPAPQAEAALTAIESASRETLRELRATLDVLRRADEDAPRAPAPGLARADELVSSARLGGLAVRIERTGSVRELPAAVDLAAYRIVQESLTNAARHSGAGEVTVRLAYGTSDLTVTVEDEGRGAQDRTGREGSGITGMRERARALGGELSAGPRPDGGFAVRARLPYGSTQA